ncbi:MAG: ABC transporter permease [Pirellulales bacterium]|nr:ABC transporter permease [Pirellulales bacterium]
MTQTWAIFLEAYRSLNSKKLFWLVLILSGLFVASFAGVGVNPQGLKILFWQIDSDLFNARQVPPDQFYKLLFTQIGIGVWLAWLATILALVSTAGIFPDLIGSGSIDLYVSKPIGRLRLFLTEYAAGLLFTALQVTIFSAACFLVIGLRGGVWEPGLFLAVPLVVCFFSYLFAVCVLLGVWTRSTVAALLLTLLFWFGVFLVGSAENTLLMFKTMNKRGVDFAAVQVEAHQQKNSTPKAIRPPTAAPTAEAEGSNDSPALDVAYDVVHGVRTVLPKTSDTIELLERALMKVAELPHQPPAGPETMKMQAAQKDLIDVLRGRSIAWILGTSLGFEAFVLFWAALLFCRRDY